MSTESETDSLLSQTRLHDGIGKVNKFFSDAAVEKFLVEGRPDIIMLGKMASAYVQAGIKVLSAVTEADTKSIASILAHMLRGATGKILRAMHEESTLALENVSKNQLMTLQIMEAVQDAHRIIDTAAHEVEVLEAAERKGTHEPATA